MRLPMLLFLLAGMCGAQHTTTPADLELQLVPQYFTHGIPGLFTFRLRNTSGHELRLPPAIVNCNASDSAVLSLNVRFQPYKGKPPGVGYGCAADNYNPPPLLEQARAWQQLAPGESVTITPRRAWLHWDTTRPGRYEVWADYQPLSPAPADRDALQAAGIRIPLTSAQSPHFVFRTRR